MKTKNTVMAARGAGITNPLTMDRKIKTLLIILLSALISIGASAQSGISKTSITKSHSLYKANQVLITMVKVGDERANNYTAKSGRFSKELELNQRYVIYIHKEGYETLSLEISTFDMDPEYKYVFVFDMIFGYEVIRIERSLRKGAAKKVKYDLI